MRRQNSASVAVSNADRYAEDEDDMAMMYPKKPLIGDGFEQARKKKQLRELRALASVSHHSSASKKALRGGQQSSMNKDNEV